MKSVFNINASPPRPKSRTHICMDMPIRSNYAVTLPKPPPHNNPTYCDPQPSGHTWLLHPEHLNLYLLFLSPPPTAGRKEHRVSNIHSPFAVHIISTPPFALKLYFAVPKDAAIVRIIDALPDST
ncbi:hypothetical protein CSKR_103100 [Clonorchis sinensis]|uniref:Uncharacterized protein n=1 Tax=Clonorchis sinensis TaxID=79923 RepID=A0A419Q8C9_CLOSI|nr:hypothetical protein CSKR_103100 [Clonorchis sinensis]